MSWKPHKADRDMGMKMVKDNLLRWICERRTTDCRPLNRRLLRDKALELAGNRGLIDVKCSERWLAMFLKSYGFLPNPGKSSRSIFRNDRLWVDIMRSVITRYEHKDLFYLNEFTIHLDVSPARISSTVQQNEFDTMKKATILMCRNASGNGKLPLFICGSFISYPAGITGKNHLCSRNEDASINDGPFREWLVRLNVRMINSGRKILLLLQRNHVGAFRGLRLSNVKHIFFPDDFPSLLRSLNKKILHFVKMIYRNKYVEEIKEHRHRWNVENVVKSLVEAWRKVPCDLIIVSFQCTRFRTDDCFLEIHYGAWKDLETRLSFKKFVTFHNLSANVSHKITSKSHIYNFRTREIIRLVDDYFNSAINSEEKKLIHHRPRMNANLIKIQVKGNDWKRKSSLKRSRDKAQLDEDEEVNGVKASDESISKNDEDIATIPAPAKFPKIIDIQTIEGAAQSSKFEIHLVRTIATSRINMDYDRKLDKIANNEERSKNNRVSSNERSIESSPEIDSANGSGIVSQQVSDNISAADSNTKNQNTWAVSCVISNDEIESTDLDGNGGYCPQKSLKRRRSRINVSSDEARNNCNDDEPKRKRSKSASDWTKAMLVFGTSDLARTIPTASADMLSSDGVQQARPRRSCERERSIFTIRIRTERIRDDFNNNVQNQ